MEEKTLLFLFLLMGSLHLPLSLVSQSLFHHHLLESLQEYLLGCLSPHQLQDRQYFLLGLLGHPLDLRNPSWAAWLSMELDPLPTPLLGLVANPTASGLLLRIPTLLSAQTPG